MKKIVLISVCFVVILATLLQTNVFATTTTLGKIVEAFNNSETINKYEKLLGYELTASTNENEPNVLSITITSDKGSSTISYEQEGNILSYTHLVDDNLITAYFLADSIGKVNGYNDGELLNNFSTFTDEISNYTVENEGFELKQNNSYYSAKMDITKKVPLIDESEFYLKPKEFDILKEIIKAGESGNQCGRKAKFAYNLEVHEDENYIYIGEKNEITESTYKSILSAIEVMYGDKVVEYFKSSYPQITDGISEFDGFKIETDAYIDLEEEPIYTDTKVVIVTIDNEYVNDELLRTEYIGETVERGDKTITLDFTTNESYKLGFFDSASASDAGFLYKYILEPVFAESDAELEDNTAYFNIVNGKIVVGDKNNSIFKIKIVVKDSYLEILPIKSDVKKTTQIAKHEKVKAAEYEEGKTQDHVRYGQYNVTVNVIYGNEIKEPIAYEVIKGARQTLDISTDKKLEFELNIEYSKFKEAGKVYIDGKIVDSSNYTSKEGSTIITFNNGYTKKLALGEHTLKVAVADGEGSTTFTIKNKAETATAEEKENSVKISADEKKENNVDTATSSKTVTNTSNPKTADNIIIYMIVFTISLVGIIVTVNKERNI